MSEVKNSNEIKVILVGDCGVGKTNLINVAVGREFNPDSKGTLAASYFKKNIEYNNKSYTLNIWDTIGHEKLRELNKIFYKGAKIVIYVYDITREDGLEEIQYWIKEIKDKLGKDGYIHAVCGNKIDLYLKEKIPESAGRKVADSINAKFKLTSAKSNKEDFKMFLEELAHDYINSSDPNGANKTFKLNKKEGKGKHGKKCC